MSAVDVRRNPSKPIDYTRAQSTAVIYIYRRKRRKYFFFTKLKLCLFFPTNKSFSFSFPLKLASLTHTHTHIYTYRMFRTHGRFLSTSSDRGAYRSAGKNKKLFNFSHFNRFGTVSVTHRLVITYFLSFIQQYKIYSVRSNKTTITIRLVDILRVCYN